MRNKEFKELSLLCKPGFDCNCELCNQHDLAFDAADGKPRNMWFKNMVSNGLEPEDAKRWVSIFVDLGV